MQAQNHTWLGTAAGTAAILAIVAIGFLMLSLKPADGRSAKSDEDNFYPIIPSHNPGMIKDQYKMREIQEAARALLPDGERLLKEYDQLPPFHVPDDPHLTQQQVDRYIKAYTDAVREITTFNRQKLGKKPGIFRIFAYVGMAQWLYRVATLRSEVQNQITDEEFNWLKKQIMLAALYCLQYNLDHGHPSADERQRLEDLSQQCRLQAGIDEHGPNDSIIHHPERLRLDQIPRGNIELFLDNYQRINYPLIHFDRPTPVTFDKQAILAAAAGNPP